MQYSLFLSNTLSIIILIVPHLNVVPLQQLGHHHAQPLVGGHAERRLAVLVKLVRVLAHRGKLVHHVRVPVNNVYSEVSDTFKSSHHFALSFSFSIVWIGGWKTTVKFLGLGGSEGPKPQSPKQPTVLMLRSTCNLQLN